MKVKGSSEAELKEKRHRVEDAVAAIKGALKYGVLPGCAKTLLALADDLYANPDLSDAVKAILPTAFATPFERIMTNGGLNKDEIGAIATEMSYTIKDELFHVEQISDGRLMRLWKRITGKKLNTKMVGVMKKVAYRKPFWNTYDALNHKFGDGIDIGVVDSASAVLMSIKNSLSVAKMLMGLSGIVVFKRDNELDASESKNFHAENAAIEEAMKNAENEKWEPPY